MTPEERQARLGVIADYIRALRDWTLPTAAGDEQRKALIDELEQEAAGHIEALSDDLQSLGNKP